MRYLKTLLVATTIIFGSCTQKEEKQTMQQDISLDGVWEMTALYSFDENGDSTLVDRSGHEQIKIYTDGYVMWSRTVPKDSTQWYGWGGYAVENGILKEWIEYGSNAFMPDIDPNDPFEQQVTYMGDTYIQTLINDEGKPEISEHYKLISLEPEEYEDEIYASLSGVWEMTKLEVNTDGEMQEQDRTGYRQVKMYKDGYVMWSQQVPQDSTEWFGFGKYSSIGGMLTEYMEFGSHSFMPFIGEEAFMMDLSIQEDTYTQIEKDSLDNPSRKEYYKRLTNLGSR